MLRELAELPGGRLRLLSPTDCIEDRLASYYYWNDKQCLEQTLLVAENKEIDILEIHNASSNRYLCLQAVRMPPGFNHRACREHDPHGRL